MFNNSSGESVVPIKCGNYFTIMVTVYIYTILRLCIFGRKEKQKNRGRSTLSNSFSFQVSDRKANSVWTVLAELCASLVFIIKCHVNVLKIPFPDVYFRLHFSVQINSFLVKRAPQAKPF